MAFTFTESWHDMNRHCHKVAYMKRPEQTNKASPASSPFMHL
jgi:hypothetical protein